MASSIFITSSDTFDVVIHYKPEGRRLKILTEPEKDAAGAIISESITATFRYPDFATSHQILRSSTTLDSTGQPSLNFLQLQTSLLYGLASKWDAKDEKGQPLELSAANISKLRVEIAKAMIEKVYAELGDNGLV